MTGYFADTHYYVALVSQDDVDHGRAVELSRQLPGRMITTAWVLTELADAFSASS
jgi:predicted nucleic acid-binding protein